LQRTTSRYYTVDFKTQKFYYSQDQVQKNISQPVPFQDLKGAELLKGRGQGKQGDCGFLVHTFTRTYELYAASEALAERWVESLNAATNLASGDRDGHYAEAYCLPDRAASGWTLDPQSRVGAWQLAGASPSPTRSGGLGYVFDEAGDDSEARCREALYQIPNDVRSAAAEREPRWAQLSWSERLSAVQSFAGGTGHGIAYPTAAQTSSPQSDGLRHRRRLAPSCPWSPFEEERLSSAALSAVPLASHAGAAHAGTTGALLSSRPGSEAWDAAMFATPREVPLEVDAARARPEVQEQCRAALLTMPCSIRSAAALEHEEAWPRFTWAERFSAVRSYCLQHGFECEDVLGAPAALRQQPVAALRDGRDAAGARQVGACSESQRLQAIFAYSDSLQMLVGHHVEALGRAVIDGMQQRDVRDGEVVIQQGKENTNMYIVNEGSFDVLIRYGEGPAVKVCQYGPGMVFGEHAMLSNAPRAATVVATSSSKLWTLEREAFRAIVRAPEESKTIGFLGGVMLLINNLAGPTIVSMPALAQEAGWLSVALVQGIVAIVACACGYMLLGAMRRTPGNSNFEQRIEFTNVAMFYLPHKAYLFVILCYHANSILSLMSLIIQSGQVIDYLILNFNGCSPGITFDESGGLSYVCGTRTDSVTPFGDRTVMSSAMVIVGVICAPFAVKNLDDNVALQYLAILGLSVMSVVWVAILVSEPDFPTLLPAMTTMQGGLIGTVLFNFAFTSALPSWVNEKRPEVSVFASFALTMGYVLVVYTVIGIVGGMAYKPFYTTDENLFSKLNAGGSKLGRVTVTAYPMLQNFTSIPVFSILIRYNLVQSGLSDGMATFIAVVMPWILSIAFYTGSGFNSISEIGGLATSSVINFIVPAALYASARRYASENQQ